MIFRGSPRPERGLFCYLSDLLPKHRGVEDYDDRGMRLWLGVNGLIAKEQRKADRQDRRQSRRREKHLRHEIDGPARRRAPKAEKMEDAVSEAVKEEARRRLDQALERAGVKE